MNSMNRSAVVLAALSTLALGACETMNTPYQSSSSQPAYPDNAYSGTGVVQSIDLVRENSGIGGSGIGVGAIAGAVIGGILGNQIGDGTGQTVATVAGAAGGAYAGNEVEKRTRGPDAYKFTLRMDNGSYQTLTQASNPDLRVGDRVRVDNGVVRRR